MAEDVATALGRERYAREWGTEFWQRVDQALLSAETVLDVGAGRRATIDATRRPRQLHYVGLDVSADELALAPRGSYTETVAAHAEESVESLVGRFDLIVSWQALEHVRHLQRAFDNFRAYLAPGGTFVGCLSGRNAAFAVANRLLPPKIASTLVARLRERDPETVFRAFYDQCDARGLRAALAGWDRVEVIPLWRGADYFMRLGPVLGLYLRYEDLAIKRGWENLATHYVVAAGVA